MSRRYEDEYFWWEIVILGRKLTYSVCGTLMAGRCRLKVAETRVHTALYSCTSTLSYPGPIEPSLVTAVLYSLPRLLSALEATI
jgi:hypothetical protein